MNQAELMAHYNEDCKPKFNERLFVKKDEDIIRELKNVILSCQRDQFFTIKVVKFEEVDDYFEIQRLLRDYEENYSRKSKSSSRKRENSYDYINLKDSDIKLLIVTYFISIKGVSRYLNVYIAVPRVINKFYMRLSGSIYSAMHQIVEASTYNNTTSTNSKSHRVVLRTILANVNLYRKNVNIKRSDKTTMKCIYYLANVFSKPLPAMKYLLAKFGYYGTLKMFNFSTDYIQITEYDPKDEDLYTFSKKDDVFISTPKYLFDNDAVLQSLVYTVYQAVIRNTQAKDMFSQEFWIRSLGLNFNNDSIEKGLSVLDSIEHVYDITTHRLIMLPEHVKANIYTLLKWMMCEFSNLRVKDNLDLATKRIRFAEYVAAMYSFKLSKGIYRIADLGNRADIDSVTKAINIAPMFLIEEMQKSTLVNYRDMVNDSDSFAALKFTYKGIAGIGEKSSNSVPVVQKMVNTSHLGRVDLNTSSNSDPGMSGILCPFADINEDGFFDKDFKEPMFWEKEFAELADNYRKMQGIREIYKFKESLGIKEEKYDDKTIDGLLVIYRKITPDPNKVFLGETEPGMPMEPSGLIRYRND